MNVLIVEPDKSAQNILIEALVDHTVVVADTAQQAIAVANDHDIDCVVLELSLGGHSGMEFLYEFRSYPDWQNTAVVVYSSVQLDESVRRSRVWKQLGIRNYLYKPKASLKELTEAIKV